MAPLTIESTRFGTVDIDDTIVLTLEQGMIGFPDLAPLRDPQAARGLGLHVAALHRDPSLAFPIVLPWVFYWDYEVDLSDEDMAAIGVERADQISIYCVVNVGADVRAATINLFSPIVVNNGDRRARQVINTGRRLLDARPAVPRRRTARRPSPCTSRTRRTSRC